MLRNQIYTAFNTFYEVESNTNPAVLYRKAQMFLDNVAVSSTEILAYKSIANVFRWQLNRMLEDAQEAIYSPENLVNLTDVLLQAQPSHTKTLKVTTRNLDNSDSLDTTYNLLLAKLPVEKFAINQHYYFLKSQNLLSNRSDVQSYANDQPIMIHSLVNFQGIEILNLVVVGNFYFEKDGVYVEELIDLAVINNTANNKVYGFYANINVFKSKIPQKYFSYNFVACKIMFVNRDNGTDTQISESYFVKPDLAYYPEAKTLIYQNQFGVFESLRLLGVVQKENEVSSESILNNGIEKDVFARFRKKLTLNLSPNQGDAEAIVDDLSLSKKIYLLEGTNLIPLVRDFKSLKSYDSSSIGETPQFDFKYPYEY